jgi:hypothetical protein
MVPGNLHLNVVADAYTLEIQSALEPFIYELVGMYTLSNNPLSVSYHILQHHTKVPSQPSMV